MIPSLLRFLWSIVAWFLGPILRLMNPKHNLPFAHPSRPPPDPNLFPRYMQNKQGIWLRWTEWSPRAAPTAVVFIVSGRGEHAGRYDSLAYTLTAEGYQVFSMDHQGQGGSEGDRSYVERFQDYVDDTQAFVKRIMTLRYGLSQLPKFLIGHSMGGLISVHLALRDQTFWNGIILSAPALEADPKVATPFMKAAASLLSDFLPKLGFEKLGVETLSTNRAVVEFAQQDPLFPGERLKARWGFEMLKNMDEVWEKVNQVKFPYVLVHSADDAICSINGSRKFHSLNQSSDKKLVEYSGMFHELFTEVNRHKVFGEVLEFIARRAK
ncbi:monoglyceride lipase, putative [Bodo saltans]|uniref:Monoglyceride lipase, putative n=1 Tax=Bodo saltans TaxID=75058 RepID=A0A0S4ITL6_BODSA|nr:monoglyceride lipase, putative [Bodo saltans]|eukprot:CUF08919.1 monoglyceride lipase, putative [Bodo saltans]